MTKLYRSIPFLALVLTLPTVAAAQQLQPPPAQTTTGDADLRPGTTTFFGDTGLWYVPTAEILASGHWSVSGYRRGTNYNQGYSNVADIAGTFAVGIADRAEVFGSFLFDTRIDRDVRPLFFNNPTWGGIIDRNPRVNTGWTGDNIGDFYVGGKVSLLSASRGAPVSFGVRGLVKIPTGDDAVGVSTGKADFALDAIASKDIASAVEISGFGGYEWRGNPDGFDIPTGAFRWGAGAAFPSHSPVRGFAELNGFIPSADTASITTATIIATDGTRPQTVSATENITRTTLGAIVQLPKGFFFGAGLSWNLPRVERTLSQAQDDPMADYWDWQIRIGYHPGIRRAGSLVARAPAPVEPAPVSPPAVTARENRPPTVKAACDPCTVEPGKTANLTATGQDPDGDQLTYRWTAPQGSLQNPAQPQTVWTAPNQEGRVPVTVTADDGHGGTATDTVEIQVVRPPARTYTFEDIHFDFDRYTLRPEATRILDEAITALQQDNQLKIEIDGHTCNIGSSEYNLALGDRRARAVRDYFVSRGVPADRLETVSYGEEMPKYDNEREETRRLNRRASLVVNLQRAANQ
jgi:outer membrane protein OmpA-like peptidoglycan-associated protein